MLYTIIKAFPNFFSFFKNSYYKFSMSAESFSFPEIYNFPPFWTMQPVKETKRKQYEMWLDIILRYMKFKKATIINIDDYLNSELFNNKKIQRNLSRYEVVQLINELVNRQNAEWIGTDQKQCKIIWRKIDEWAAIIYDWAKKRNFIGTVLTFYEITKDDDTQGESFHMLEESIFDDAIKYLESKGKAVFFPNELFDERGVRFV